MNPTTAVRLQGYRIAFPGYLPWNPGSAIPFGGPQQQLAFYQDFNWVKGRHDLRFGGYYMHMNDDRTFGAYANSVQSLNTTSAALPSLDNFVRGQIRRYQGAINPNGFPGGTYTTPVGFPSFTSYNKYDEFALYANDTWSITDRLKINLGLRYEYFGPQKKSEPKYDSNFYYSDDGCSVNSSGVTEILDCIRGGTVLTSNESPSGNLWANDWNNFAPRVGFAWDVTGDGKTSLRGGYGIGYERNFGNVTYNVLFNPPEYLVASIDAPTDTPTLPIYTDNQGPFGGVAGVTKPIPAGSLRHVDQNMETAYNHFYSLSLQREVFTNAVASIEYTGSTGRKLYDLADPNKRGAGLVYQGIGTASAAPDHPVRRLQHPRQPRPVAVPRGDAGPRLAQAREHRDPVHHEVHVVAGQGQPQLDVLGLGRELQPGLHGRVRPDAGLRLRRVRHPPPADLRRRVGAAPLPQLRGCDPDHPRRLAAQLDLHRPQRPSLLALGLHERPRHVHARRGPGRHRPGTPRTAPPRPTRTSST